MLHTWIEGTDGNGSTIRTILFDYRKAFDLIDHRILVRKLRSLDLPVSIINWIIDFLSNRFQRVKLVEGCVSEWGSVPSGVPQGTKLGPWLFIIMINDLVSHETLLWKYVDDTTVSEVVPKEQTSNVQEIVDRVVDWSKENKFQLNRDKCKELRISFAKNKVDLPPVVVDGHNLEVVDHAKLLGVTITSNLSWNMHVSELVKKASKRLYFLRQLKRAHVEKALLLRFYTSCIRSVCDYAIPVFHASLPQYLIDDLERVQKRALSIICPTLSYDNALASLDLELLVVHHHRLCQSLFNSILEDTDHRLRHLLPVSYSPKYSLRHPRAFGVKFKTYRARNCFINSQCLRVNSSGQPSDF